MIARNNFVLFLDSKVCQKYKNLDDIPLGTGQRITAETKELYFWYIAANLKYAVTNFWYTFSIHDCWYDFPMFDKSRAPYIPVFR